MALTTCKDCGGEVSTDAKACPKCGKPRRVGVDLGRVVGLLILAAILLYGVRCVFVTTRF